MLLEGLKRPRQAVSGLKMYIPILQLKVYDFGGIMKLGHIMLIKCIFPTTLEWSYVAQGTGNMVLSRCVINYRSLSSIYCGNHPLT